MGHNHHHESTGRKLVLTIVLNLIITIAQVVGGIVSGSLALISDALHNFSDVLSLVITFYAHRISNNSPSEKNTFGLKRAEILAALLNSSTLVVIGIFIFVESIKKIFHPDPIASIVVIALAAISILLNIVSVLLIKEDENRSLNIRAAYLHLLTDVMTSIAVLIGGIFIHYFQAYWIDSVISTLIAFYLIYSAWGILKESVSILMQASPSYIKIDDLITEILLSKDIKNVHHIHLWNLSDDNIFLEAHLDFHEDFSLSKSITVAKDIKKRLENKFSLNHITFQCEFLNSPDPQHVLGKN